MNVFLIIESDFIFFCFGIVMLICIKIKSGKSSYNINWIMLLLGMVLIMQMLLIFFWALSFKQNVVFVKIRNIDFFIYYIFNDLMPLIWALYVYMQITHGKEMKKYLVIFTLPVIFSLVLIILNPFYHDLYFISSFNKYHTGNLFYWNAACCYFYLLIAELIPLIFHKKISSRQIIPLMIFSLPPLIGSIIQFIFGGIDLIWSCAILSLLILYVGVLNDRVNLDYLTGIYNRMQADVFLEKKIDKSTSSHTFSGIMIDIDKFKEINDKCGHYSGDEALEITARLLKKISERKISLHVWAEMSF